MSLKKYMTCTTGRMLCALVLLAWSAICVHAEPTGQAVDQLKTAYIYNFAKFIEMPSRSDDKSLRICQVGKDDLGGTLQALNQRIAQGREIAVRKDVSLDQLQDCAVVFMGRTDVRGLSAIVRQIELFPLLFISDMPNAVEKGAHLGLVVSDDRVGFDVNLPLLQKSGIKASSQMLKLARSVIR